MNVVLYFLCLALLLPMAGFAAFGFVIDSIVKFGLWKTFTIVFSPLSDPFGKGIWFYLMILSVLGISGAAFIPEARPYGFGAMAIAGVLCVVYVLRVYPDGWSAGSVLFIPSAASIAISVYCIVRPPQ